MTLFMSSNRKPLGETTTELKNRRADMEYQARDKQLFSRNRGRKYHA
jgi:hypothetical protein